MNGFASRLLKRVDASCEKHSRLYLALFSIVFLVSEAFKAVRKPFWYDELFTYYVARLRVGGVWNALQRTIEVHPPLSFWLTAISQSLIGPSPLATRLPMLLAFWFACLFLYLAASRLLPRTLSFSATLLLVLSGAEYYATEARPYSLMLAASALAYYAWQVNPQERRWWTLPLLTLAIAAAVSSHYLGVLVGLPLCAGEFVRTIRKKKLEATTWIALAAGLIPLIFYWPLTRQVTAIYSAHNRNPATFSALTDSYTSLLLPLVPAIILIFISLVIWNTWAAAPASEPDALPALPPEETAALASFCAIPLVAFAIGPVTHSLHPRYVIATVLGAVLLLLIICWRGFPRRAAGSLVLIALLLLLTVQQVPRALTFLTRHGRSASNALPPSNLPNDLPIVIESPLIYLPAFYYAAPALRARLHYIASPADSVRTTGSDTMDHNLLQLKQIAPLQVDTYPGILSVPGRRFLLLVSRDYPDGWELARIVALGGSAQFLSKPDSDTTAYLVRMPPSAY